MGFFSNLTEGLFKIRVVPKQDASEKTSFANDKNKLTTKINEAIDSGKRIDLSELMSITSLKVSRDKKYSIFEEMVEDGRIGAAIEMYANDTVQYNSEGKIIWVESNNTDTARYANNLLNDLNIAESIWSYAYCMWLYGDVYVELFEQTSVNENKPTLLVEPIKNYSNVRSQVDIQGSKLERYIEKVANAAEVYDLERKGKTVGFIRSKNLLENNLHNNTYTYQSISNNVNIFGPTKFIHICLSPNINRYPEKFTLIPNVEHEEKLSNGTIDISNQEGTSSGNLSFTVKTGQSVLENVYSSYKTLKLKEDSVLLERVTKASITRVIQVELGDLPESQKRKKLQEIKQQIEQQLIMNKESGILQSRPGAQAIENIVYTTTKNGKGAISTVNIGGDVDIGDLADLTQAENKMYGSLLVPKALLGADMEGSGLSNGGSLTELNTTYARRIKRGQIALTSAIKTLINIFALSEGVGEKHVNNFEVKLTPIITIEDNRRDELLQDKIRNVNDTMSLLDDIEQIDNDLKLEMLINWLSKYLGQQDVVDIINRKLNEIKEEEKEQNLDSEEDLEIEEDLNNNFDASESSFESQESNEIDLPDLETDNDIDLAEIEGEDLV